MPRGKFFEYCVTSKHFSWLAGKFTNHKGRNRRFTNPEELEEERRKEEQKKKWRQQQGDASTSEEDEEASGEKKISEEGSDDSEEESSSEEEVCPLSSVLYNNYIFNLGQGERCVKSHRN